MQNKFQKWFFATKIDWKFLKTVPAVSRVWWSWGVLEGLPPHFWKIFFWSSILKISSKAYENLWECCWKNGFPGAAGGGVGGGGGGAARAGPETT
jgi:hypothetical protein